jgi:DNA-binding IscR family transcriptional regulator
LTTTQVTNIWQKALQRLKRSLHRRKLAKMLPEKSSLRPKSKKKLKNKSLPMQLQPRKLNR